MSDISNLGKKRSDNRKKSKSMDATLETSGTMVLGEVKTGNTKYHFATGPKRLHVTGPNQSITGDEDGTKVQAGREFTLSIKSTDAFKLDLENGQYALHPQVHQRPSTDAFPLQVFVSSVPNAMRQVAKMSKAVQKFKELLSL